MTTLKEGDKAPEFELQDQNGKTVSISDFKGKKVIVYFYPKDDTPGCTKQACDLKDNISSIKKKNAVVLGISPDDENSHKKFEEKYGLNFTILCDVDKKVSNAYGVYGLKQFMGKESYGIIRSTFVIDEKGVIGKIFYKVNPEQHLAQVLEVL
jgi:thioredoxin-dependent peroxiredoxin